MTPLVALTADANGYQQQVDAAAQAEMEARLWRNEFFRDCLAPQDLKLKVRAAPHRF